MCTSAGFKISPIHLYRTLFWRHNHGEGLWPLALSLCLARTIIDVIGNAKATISASLHHEDYEGIIASMAGVIFLGTPHRGSGSQSWARLIGGVAAKFGLGKPGIVDIIESNSTALRDQLYDFALVVNRKTIPLFCFFEQHESDISKIVVPKPLQLVKYRVCNLDAGRYQCTN